MTFKDFQKSGRRQELSQERQQAVIEITATVHEATRANIHRVLGLPGPIRPRLIDQDANYRKMLKDRMERYIDQPDKQETVAADRDIIRNIIENIDEIDRISAEIDLLNHQNGDVADGNQ